MYGRHVIRYSIIIAIIRARQQSVLFENLNVYVFPAEVHFHRRVCVCVSAPLLLRVSADICLKVKRVVLGMLLTPICSNCIGLAAWCVCARTFAVFVRVCMRARVTCYVLACVGVSE